MRFSLRMNDYHKVVLLLTLFHQTSLYYVQIGQFEGYIMVAA